MPVFIVRRRVDAFVDYTTKIEADSPEAAAETAAQFAGDLNWVLEGQHECDAEAYVALDRSGNEIANSERGDFV